MQDGDRQSFALSSLMPGARAVPGRSVTAAQLPVTFGLSLSKASAHQHNHDVEQLLESLAVLSPVEGSKGSAQQFKV